MKGILLVNLGSPKSTDLDDVTEYLDEFLMDERVVDYPLPLRKLIVRGIILKNRPPKTQANYKRIWWDEGSPLIVYTKRLQKKIGEQINIPISIAMRYAAPSLKTGLQELKEKGVDEILVIPLFPQYAMATIQSASEVITKLVEEHFPETKVNVFPPFYNHPDYIEVLANSMAEKLNQIDYDHLLFSYHGIPERHLKKTTGCVSKGLAQDELCCSTTSKAHQFCYRHQCLETTRLVAEKLNLKEGTFSNCFQSRLGPIPWLKPYTDKQIIKLAKNGTKKLAIASPAFVADCIETIDELGREGQEDFIEKGGKEFHLIPCLNDRQDWADVLSKWIKEWQEKEVETRV